MLPSGNSISFRLFATMLFIGLFSEPLDSKHSPLRRQSPTKILEAKEDICLQRRDRCGVACGFRAHDRPERTLQPVLFRDAEMGTI